MNEHTLVFLETPMNLFAFRSGRYALLVCGETEDEAKDALEKYLNSHHQLPHFTEWVMVKVFGRLTDDIFSYEELT